MLTLAIHREYHGSIADVIPNGYPPPGGARGGSSKNQTEKSLPVKPYRFSGISDKAYKA